MGNIKQRTRELILKPCNAYMSGIGCYITKAECPYKGKWSGKYNCTHHAESLDFGFHNALERKLEKK